MTDWDEGALGALRSAASLGRGAAGVELLRVRPLEPVLQYAGDVLVAALGQAVPGTLPLAEKCLQALNARGEAGDRELAVELVQALAGGHDALTRVPVDLGELAGALHGRLGDGPFVIDLARGDVLPVDEAVSMDGTSAEALAGECGEQGPGYDRERWLTLSPEAAPAASAGPGPAAPGGEPPGGDFAREERERGRARLWLAAYGLSPAPRHL
ncbi:hypothetical protein [Actinomadura rudentiformis]|uniref:Uncharacterized protein n=1 Tax=Actinomadura rudentiformis TaxID=359158 RepID=A0A6H9Z2Y9_9ACTN|nr:hypothetical protein [Actinomadura rudentiformis]KAB2351411.1 hypothetical protein F8566_03915 [Actinomadura rudentiformis]